jgi:polar amino acid transport system substrate-binding protein
MAVTAVASALMLAACGGRSAGTTAATRGGVRLVTPGKLTTCTHLPYEPFQFRQGGKVVGFDVDVVDLAAKRLGVTQEVVDIDFAVIKSGAALNSGKCDLAAAGMSITDERKKNIDFSVPYFDASQGLMTRKGSGVTSLDDVRAKHLTLGAQASTTGLDYVKRKGFDPIEFADSSKELLALQTGQVDVLVQDLPVVLTWLKKPQIAARLQMVGSLNTGERYGIGMKKGNTALANAVNQSIQTAEKNGTYNALYKKWFGTAPTPTATP